MNIGNPDEFTILECARQVLAVTGSASKLRFGPLPQDDPRQRRPDIGRFERGKQGINTGPCLPHRLLGRAAPDLGLPRMGSRSKWEYLAPSWPELSKKMLHTNRGSCCIFFRTEATPGY